jgi:hypothetical protein
MRCAPDKIDAGGHWNGAQPAIGYGNQVSAANSATIVASGSLTANIWRAAISLYHDSSLGKTVKNTPKVNGGGNKMTDLKNVTADTVIFSGTGMTGSVDTLNASSGTLVVQDRTNVIFNGNSEAITAVGNDTLAIDRNNDSATTGKNVNVNVYGNGNTITSTSGTIQVIGGASVTINATNQIIDVGGGATVVLNGSGDTVVGGAWDTFQLAGQNLSISASTSQLTFIGNHTGDKVTGNGNTIIYKAAAAGAPPPLSITNIETAFSPAGDNLTQGLPEAPPSGFFEDRPMLGGATAVLSNYHVSSGLNLFSHTHHATGA